MRSGFCVISQMLACWAKSKDTWSRRSLIRMQLCPLPPLSLGITCCRLLAFSVFLRSTLDLWQYSFKVNSEIVKRWSNEVQEAMTSKNPLVQYHALGLLHRIKQNDRLAVSKLVTQLSRSPMRSSLAQCLVIRYVAQVSVSLNSFCQLKVKSISLLHPDCFCFLAGNSR